MPLSLLAAIVGFSVIWLALDEHAVVAGVIGGMLFGGGFVGGVFGR